MRKRDERNAWCRDGHVGDREGCAWGSEGCRGAGSAQRQPSSVEGSGRDKGGTKGPSAGRGPRYEWRVRRAGAGQGGGAVRRGIRQPLGVCITDALRLVPAFIVISRAGPRGAGPGTAGAMRARLPAHKDKRSALVPQPGCHPSPPMASTLAGPSVACPPGTPAATPHLSRHTTSAPAPRPRHAPRRARSNSPQTSSHVSTPARAASTAAGRRRPHLCTVLDKNRSHTICHDICHEILAQVTPSPLQRVSL